MNFIQGGFVPPSFIFSDFTILLNASGSVGQGPLQFILSMTLSMVLTRYI